jgi:hypothetical protein
MFLKKAIIFSLIFILLIFSSCSESIEEIEKYDAEWLASELSFVPTFIEADFFENEVLGQFPEPKERPYQFVQAYYALADPNAPPRIDMRPDPNRRNLERYPFIEQTQTPFYIFDPNANDTEYAEILGYFNDYTSLTNGDIIKMWDKYNLPDEHRNNERNLYGR